MGKYVDSNDIIFISHGDALEDAEFVRDEIQKRFGISTFMINHIGPTIGSPFRPWDNCAVFYGRIQIKNWHYDFWSMV